MTHAFRNATPTTANQFCAKVPYESRQAAMRKLREHRPPIGEKVIGKGTFNAYLCRSCGMYHLGHK